MENDCEKEFIAGIIWQGFSDYVEQDYLIYLLDYRAKTREEIKAICLWFASVSDKPFSFLWCCDVVALEPDPIISQAKTKRFKYRKHNKKAIAEAKELYEIELKKKQKIWRLKSRQTQLWTNEPEKRQWIA